MEINLLSRNSKMNKKTITIDYPEDILLALNETSEEFARNCKLLLAIKLYEIGKLSLGKAAELANIAKVDFIQELDKYKIPVIKYSIDSLEEEINLVEELANE